MIVLANAFLKTKKAVLALRCLKNVMSLEKDVMSLEKDVLHFCERYCIMVVIKFIQQWDFIPKGSKNGTN